MSDSPYEAYLARAGAILGSVEVGGYGKYQGRLVKKLTSAEFGERWHQYQATKQQYDQILEQGDTVNDAIVQLLKEHASELLIDE
ncbi:MAG: hypothetical protein KC503_30180 [Myxococcales bacterium]|nr:hypothetical protein [Myxococcales bacterium]